MNIINELEDLTYSLGILIISSDFPADLKRYLNKKFNRVFIGVDAVPLATKYSNHIDLILFDCIKKFGKRKVCEVNTTSLTPNIVAKHIIDILEKRKNKKVGIVDWLGLAEKDKELLKFLT